MPYFDDAVHKLATDLADMIIRKQRDYGTRNILGCPVGVEEGILVRLHDKLARLSNLLKNQSQPNNESIDDSWRDVAGYALVALLVRENSFELPLKTYNNQKVKPNIKKKKKAVQK